MDNQRVFKMSFARVDPHYVQKAERKGRTKQEVDEVGIPRNRAVTRGGAQAT